MTKDAEKISEIWLCIMMGVMFVVICVIFAIKVNDKSEESTVHNYVSTTVTDKYINEGYGSWYAYKDTEYVVVSESNYGDIITTIVGINEYNSLNLGDEVLYCRTHNKLEIYE